MDKIAVLIPCYNEAKTIEKVVLDWRQALPEAMIYVYDNNSDDNTADIARRAGAIVRREYMQGKGNVIRRMFREVDALCYLMVDGDDTYSPEHAREMADKVLYHHVDMVIGDRLSSTYYVENKRPFHNMGNSLVRAMINTLFRTDIRDIMTGCRGFSYQFVKTFPVLSRGFEIETEMTIHAVDKNMQTGHVIVGYRDRPCGSMSKLNTFSDGIQVLKLIGKLFRNYKPDIFFSILAGALECAALGLFLPILIKFYRIQSVPNFPTLIVACFIALAGIVSFFSGLVLSSIAQKDRRDFEMRLIETDRYLKETYGQIREENKEPACGDQDD